MSANEIITLAIRSGVLMEQLTTIPEDGASVQEIALEEEKLSRGLSLAHKDFLSIWNGGNFEVIQMYGCAPSSEGLMVLSEKQELVDLTLNDPICFAEDPAGFSYLEDSQGAIFRQDHEYNRVEKVASGLDDFFEQFVFGKSAAGFGGDDWLAELIEAGVIESN